MKIPFSTLAVLFTAFSEDLVEHAMDVALGLASRAYVMSKGAIVFKGTSEELSADKEVRKRRE